MPEKPTDLEKKREPGQRSGVYEEDDQGKLQEQRDRKLADLQKKDQESEKDRKPNPEDEFVKIAEKISKARDKYLEAEALTAEATSSDDPNLEAYRGIRTKYYGEYKLALDELMRRARLDLEK